VLHDVKVLVFGHVGHVIHELRRRRVEGVGERRFGMRGITVTKGALVAIKPSSGG
jgi:hypothetical protein